MSQKILLLPVYKEHYIAVKKACNTPAKAIWAPRKGQ